MLHDPSHRPQPITTEEIELQPAEKEVLRRLVAEVAQMAALPVHREKAELWRRLNDLESDRPMVWINEIPWHEMNVNDELTLRTQHPWAREWETTLRQTLYQWRHLPADIIVSDFIECPLAIHSTDFGTVIMPPVIPAHPQGQVALQYSTVTMSVTATGTPPLVYRWRRNGFTVTGQANATLVLTNVSPRG